MKRTWVLLLTGLVLFTALLAWRGIGEVLSSFAEVGWGVLIVAAFHLVPLSLDAAGWSCLFGKKRRLTLLAAARMRWIGESVNGLLPVAQVGGEVIKTRLLMRTGIPGPRAGASVVVALTIAFSTQIAFTMLGLGLLALRAPGSDVIAGIGIGLTVAALAMFAFYVVQRLGMFRVLFGFIGKIMGDPQWIDLIGGPIAMDAAVRTLWRKRSRLLLSVNWHSLGWVVGAGECYLALYFLGFPVTWQEALILESIGQAARAAGFAIPGALGVQEGGYLLAGRAVGLSDELAIAVSLVRRSRDVLLGLPGLLAWQVAEGRRFWQGRRAVPDRSA